MAEAWLEAERREAAWDRRLAGRPMCADCGERITEEECLPVEDGVLCPRCVRRRMVPTEDV